MSCEQVLSFFASMHLSTGTRTAQYLTRDRCSNYKAHLNKNARLANKDCCASEAC